MKIFRRATGFVGLSIIVLVMMLPHAEANSLAGMEYSIYLYNTDVASATMSFEANLSMFIDAYNGFGYYLPIGSAFVASYWSPNYNKTNDLFLLMNGIVIADYIWGWGLSFPNYRFTSMFFFSGYAVMQ
jgi:hypothetical protein